jgi:hypothetical protein
MKTKEEINILVSEKRYNELLAIEKVVKNKHIAIADDGKFWNGFTCLSESEAIDKITSINNSNGQELARTYIKLYAEEMVSDEIDTILKKLKVGGVFNFIKWKYGSKTYNISQQRETFLRYLIAQDKEIKVFYDSNK